MLFLQDVESNEDVEPLQLPSHLVDSWDRIVILGNQPVVPQEGKVVWIWTPIIRIVKALH